MIRNIVGNRLAVTLSTHWRDARLSSSSTLVPLFFLFNLILLLFFYCSCIGIITFLLFMSPLIFIINRLESESVNELNGGKKKNRMNRQLCRIESWSSNSGCEFSSVQCHIWNNWLVVCVAPIFHKHAQIWSLNASSGNSSSSIRVDFTSVFFSPMSVTMAWW